MNWRWLATIPIWLAITHAAPHSNENSAVLEAIRNETGLPAVTAAVVRNGQFQGDVAGVRKLREPVSAGPKDKFHIGSLTKAMTATLIGVLVDQGRLDWDATLPEVLPDLADTLPLGHRNTTISMLGAHRSGIADDYITDKEFLMKLYEPGLSPVEGRSLLISRILSREPALTPGEFNYDNTNYAILGRVVENLMNGQLSWEENIKEHLFQPLGMDCGFGVPPESSETSIDNPWGHIVASLSEPPVPAGGPLIMRDNVPAIAPAGAVHCDMESYTTFLQLHLNGYLGRPTQLNISPETFKHLHTPYPNPPNGPLPYTPGAWVHYDGSETPWSNGPFLWHDGSNTMFYGESILAPGLGEAGEVRAAVTNIGNSMEGGTAPAGDGIAATFLAITEGRLFGM